VAVVNNVEADHLECYGSVEALERAFVEFAGRAERVLIGSDDPGADRVAAALASDSVWRFGPGSGNDVAIGDLVIGPAGTRAVVRFPDGAEVRLELQVPGLHNLRNATAALGAVKALGGSLERAAQALAEFSGVARRFERIGEVGGVTVVDDYAHHPSELRATLTAARQAFPGRRLVAVFQPHLYSRTALHGTAMGQALALADLAVVADVYGAREAPVPGVTGELVARAAEREGVRVVFEPNRAELENRVAGLLESGDVLITLGAGDVTTVGRRLVAGAAA
jgi:UDP-N-acetylmuramate--alanine ligase